jgi:transposase
MTKPQVEVITSVQRRRRWPRAEKERIVAAALAPGAVASEVARSAGIHVSQLFRWRQELCERAPMPAAFNPVVVGPEPGAASPIPASTASPERAGVIEIEIESASGGRMRIPHSPAISRIRATKIRNLASGSRAWSRTTGGTPPSSGRTNCSVMRRHCTAFQKVGPRRHG